MTHATPLDAAGPVAATDYRDAMALLASAVHLVTTHGPGGRAGFTASSVCSVSDAPATLLVCLNRAASAYPSFRDSDILCVNTLADAQADVAKAFGGGTPMDQRFACADWDMLVTGAPILSGALVSFDCRVVQRTAMATHDVLFCEVIALVGAPHRDGLVYAQRGFHRLAPRVSGQPGQRPTLGRTVRHAAMA